MQHTPEGYAVHVDEGCEGEIFNGPLGCWHSKNYTILQEDAEDMTNAVTTYQGGAVAESREFTPEDVETLKTTICKGATDSELKLFIATCKHTGLDPFMRQIHAVKRWDSNEKREVMAIQVGIDGYRLTARRTGEMQGMDGPYWTYDGETWVELPREGATPLAARVIVYRKGSERGYPAIARWSAYVQTTREGKPNSMWTRMGPEQLAKCAEALALRRAFPAELAALPQHVEYDESTEYGDDWTPEQVRDQYVAEHPANVIESGHQQPGDAPETPEPANAQDNPAQDDEPEPPAYIQQTRDLPQMQAEIERLVLDCKATWDAKAYGQFFNALAAYMPEDVKTFDPKKVPAERADACLEYIRAARGEPVGAAP